MRRRIAVCQLVSAAAAELSAQDLPSDVTFTLKKSWLESLLTGGPDGHSVGARWTATFRMGDHSTVHALNADCELHVDAPHIHATSTSRRADREVW